ncbi:MAG: hypothetical protein ABII22_04685 [Candidatus Micrarchaeota archaeon]
MTSENATWQEWEEDFGSASSIPPKQKKYYGFKSNTLDLLWESKKRSSFAGIFNEIVKKDNLKEYYRRRNLVNRYINLFKGKKQSTDLEDVTKAIKCFLLFLRYRKIKASDFKDLNAKFIKSKDVDLFRKLCLFGRASDSKLFKYKKLKDDTRLTLDVKSEGYTLLVNDFPFHQGIPKKLKINQNPRHLKH